ncbi:PKD domain-containing protein, partial [Candidatus Bathyarchaeota archaeon]|nr:PKD domain-containing protein [Candidatus Bathyarchaeota archaeon]
HTIYVEVIFKVPEFKITTVPSSIALVPGDHSSTSILVTSDFFSGAVDLRASITPYTAHELVISLDSAQVLLTSNGVGRVVLNLATSQTASPRVYTVQINGISNRHFANATMTAIVVSHPYSVGVQVGQSASYALTTSNASLPQILIVLTVTSISGSNVSYSAEYYVQDHALNSTGGWIDAATGYMLQPVVPFFLAPTNLGIGDTVYLDPVYGALRITSLDRGVSAGVNRNIVRFESANPTGQTQVSWDQATGIMVSLDVVIPVNSTQLAIHYLLISTDAWTGLQMSFHPLTHVPFSTPVAFKADVDGGSSPYNYVWHFGDGSSSTEENPSHMYPKQGDYVVTVDVTDSAGNMIERSQTITIDAPSSHDIPTPITALNLLPIIGAWLRANIVLAVLIFSGAWLALSLTLAALTLRKKSPRPSS